MRILPYSQIVGQEALKLALELAYIAPRLGGVLISGQRGTGKSTAVRAFAQMMHGELPVTLPINATEDRVVGGWKIDELMINSKPVRQEGLLEDADRKGMLYIDEVNLLDDHIVNIILDVTSTGVLVVQREAQNVEEKQLSFTLVGTMNPEEGNLRPQLLDRFGVMVNVSAEEKPEKRLKILQTVMDFDEALMAEKDGQTSDYLVEAEAENQELCQSLKDAKAQFYNVKVPRKAAESCVKLTQAFEAEGNRGDYVMALAAKAYAARQSAKQVANKHIAEVASMVLQHRQPEVMQGSQISWNEEDTDKVKEILKL
ncbi:MAG: AAA domain-containing protein [Leptolyngbya sp. SIOISBB]|nr:AAA domain-containing protein [Leptolyngbya sp. SIOISBB]